MACPEIGKQVHDAVGKAFALGLDDFLLRFRVGRQKIRGAHRIHHLLDRETDFLLGFRRRLHRIRHGVQKARIQQIGGGIEGMHLVRLPRLVIEAAVDDLRHFP